MEPNRRKFIKSSALVAGATALPIIGSAQAAGSGTLKVALVGCGGRGTGAAKQILANPGIEVVALADAFAPSIAKCLGALNDAKKGQGSSVNVPAEHQFTGLDAYKKATDLADIVMLCTPPGFRPKHFAYAVEKGKHVFMEKPVATTADGVRIVLEAAKKAKPETKIVVGFQRRFDPVYLETLKRIQDGMIGDLISAQVHWMGGNLWVRDREPGDTEFQYQCRNWFYFDYIGGDGIVEQHIHNIDVANWFLGTLPERAYGTGGRSVRIGPQFGNIYDHFATEYSYPKGVVVNSFWRHHQGAQGRVGELFLAAKGRAQPGTIWDRDGKELWKYDGPRADGQQIEQDELVAHIRQDKPINMAEAAANSTMTALLGRQACYSGNSIPWSRGLGAKDKMVPDADDFGADVPAKPGPDGLYPAAIPGQYNPLDPFA
ncbi:MAG: Gfo/Idh/MocA family protein [Verrucomicrobiales bacterium]